MNIILTDKKISQDERILAFKKDNLTAQMTFTVDTDDSWTYKLDVRLPAKCCTGEELFNIIDLPMDASRTCTIDVTAAMVPFTGKYTMQLRGINGEQVYHSDTFEIWVKYSIDPGAVYDPVPSEFYQIEQNVTEMNNHPPKPGENGYWLIWDITTQQYKESAIPLPDGTLPDITADTSGKYLSNDGKKAYWTEVQAGEGNKINKIEVNGVEQSIVDKTVNISVPTKTSDLSNDSGYITNEALTGYATKAELPTKVSQLENDSKFINESALDGYAKIADIPTKTSQLNNDSGYITANDVPVKSVDGATGDIVTNAVKTTQQTLTDTQKQQARTNIGAGTSSFDGDYNSLTNKPTIPTKISELDNDSGFITEANIPVKSVNGKTGNVTLDAKAVGALPDTTTIPSKTSELDNDSGFITSDALSGKQDKVTGAATTITNSNLTANCALISDTNGKVAASPITATELSSLDGVTSNVQTQLNSKQPTITVNGIIQGDGAGNLSAADLNSTTVGLGNVDNIKQYSATNPPPYPVTSVNGETGAVMINVPIVPSTTDILKGNGSGEMVAATPETDYASPVFMRKVTLPVASWDSNTKQQSVTVTGILADTTKQCIYTAPVDTSYDSAWNSCGVLCVAQDVNSLTFQCGDVPTIAIEVYVTVITLSYKG